MTLTGTLAAVDVLCVGAGGGGVVHHELPGASLP